ncbi:XRE family transcriptional regulator [Coprococcus catus]|uniref:XRE family transcriptional regulator n=1 Tax=Coprococcus catus TaxID=116085 RepID=A0A3E2TEP9_9FIRM|nr:XRE family transcriptional regulator [Coprococcus catus]
MIKLQKGGFILNERLKELRNYLGLSQEAFGETVGVTKAAISRIESGINSLSDRMILSIVTQHNVSEEWLRTGNGSMFNAMSEDEELDLYVGRISGGSDEFKKNLIKTLCKLSEDEWDVLKKIISEMK